MTTDDNHDDDNTTAAPTKRRGRPPKATAPAAPAPSTAAKALAAAAIPESRWGRIDLSAQVVPTLPAGRYAANIVGAVIRENDTALYLIVTYEVTSTEGEVFTPDPQILTIAGTDEMAARVRDGRVMLSRIATAVADQGITIAGALDPADIAASLVGASVTVTIAVTGQGVGRKNVVRTVSAPVK